MDLQFAVFKKVVKGFLIAKSNFAAFVSLREKESHAKSVKKKMKAELSVFRRFSKSYTRKYLCVLCDFARGKAL
jgi:hypothetical protein